MDFNGKRKCRKEQALSHKGDKRAPIEKVYST